MNIWQSALLTTYFYGSYPWRALRNARLRATGRSPVIILFYHRVADDRANPWTISNRTFARQIHWLKRHFELISLREAQSRVRSTFQDRPSVAITFDDGYADNSRYALPLLVDEQVPCTYFVTTRHVLTGAPFGHDVAVRRPLAPNSPQEIRQLARAGIEIGSHTRTHADLGCITDQNRLYAEIVLARAELEVLAEAPIRYFAIPYGQHAQLNAEVFRLARVAGYEAVCSAYGGFNFPGGDAFHLQRVPVDDDLIRLKNWTTVDPRKLRIARPGFKCVDETPGAAEPAGTSK